MLTVTRELGLPVVTVIYSKAFKSVQEDHGRYPCSQALLAVDVRTSNIATLLPFCFVSFERVKLGKR